MWRTRNPLWKAHDPEDIGEILLLQLGPRRHRPRDAGAFIDERFKVLERDLHPSRHSTPERILHLVRTGQILAIVLVDHAQVGAELVTQRCAGNEAAVEKSAIVVRAAVRAFGVDFNELAAHKPAPGRTVKDRAAWSCDTIDEELAGMFGILCSREDAVAFAPVGRRDPSKSLADTDRIFGEIWLARRRSRWNDMRAAMREDDQMPVPVFWHRRQEIGAARMLGGIAGCDVGDGCGTYRRVRQRGLHRLLGADRHACQNSKKRKAYRPKMSHGFPLNE